MPMNMAGRIAKYLAISLAMENVVSAPRVMRSCLPMATTSMSLVGLLSRSTILPASLERCRFPSQAGDRSARALHQTGLRAPLSFSRRLRLSGFGGSYPHSGRRNRLGLPVPTALCSEDAARPDVAVPQGCIFHAQHSATAMTQRNIRESGNVFFTLFGAIALVGVVGVATATLMRGPVGTMVSLNERTKADTELQ